MGIVRIVIKPEHVEKVKETLGKYVKVQWDVNEFELELNDLEGFEFGYFSGFLKCYDLFVKEAIGHCLFAIKEIKDGV